MAEGLGRISARMFGSEEHAIELQKPGSAPLAVSVSQNVSTQDTMHILKLLVKRWTMTHTLVSRAASLRH